MNKQHPSESNILPEILCAASLAHHGLLGSLKVMELRNVDLTSVPAQHLASLVSNVKYKVGITNVSGCGLVMVLDSVKCKTLSMGRQNLDREETQALVGAMESAVENIMLNQEWMCWMGDDWEVTLDIDALTKYSGQGKCREIWWRWDRYGEQLRTWATSKNWEDASDCENNWIKRS